ncbi:hypothetical protein [Brevibacillus brevis]|uniref:hypothetical protein n=1 Tax=Brevibacillus brevis TaxID=1393 RepID=UPI000D10712E|nr:hypothetical protein [Brevibacillus brevis]PSJ63491.1 hypothetical protein C7J99_31495 [Brevibacillus brevis]RED21259.1 hypothetical protein DES34_12297 [Brevibacillus brevis]VEF87608.1 Uncharacterised protein [Brevibacillus brevis]VEF90160.1 Uncharacterised protein [Brevibacillus brevis]GEC93799.1 hypothetical protein BBR01nite_61300 [Brevibacillus brevis]
MDYKAFYDDVVGWINQANQAAVMYGMHTEQFWAWVADSSAAISKKYRDNPLVIKQMLMLVNWLEEAYENNAHGGKGIKQ